MKLSDLKEGVQSPWNCVRLEGRSPKPRNCVRLEGRSPKPNIGSLLLVSLSLESLLYQLGLLRLFVFYGLLGILDCPKVLMIKYHTMSNDEALSVSY